MYRERMSEFFKKNPVIITEYEPYDYRKKTQAKLRDIEGKFYISKLNYKPPPFNKPILMKEDQKIDDMKASLEKENYDWNGWKFQMHWNKLESVDPKRHNQKKIPFCTPSLDFHIKYYNMACH